MELTAIKLLHTVIWAGMAGCVLALPFAGWRKRFRLAAALIGVILAECIVLALNGGRCPLTDWAARYTSNRADNFDIYLPIWLARHNKRIFGTMFVVNVTIVAWRWVRRGQEPAR
ncbi:MAG: hypothetical protein ACRD3E_21050 [Terriglobales bacterium]